MRRFTWSAVILGAIGLLAACASHGAKVEGQVFEAMSPEAASQGNRLPSADAYVVVHWTATVPQLGHATSTCLRAAISKTDERGRFEVSGWWAVPKFYPAIQQYPAVMVYKPGFDQQFDPRNPGAPTVRTLVRSKLPAEQRIVVLSLYAEAGCTENGILTTVPLVDPQGIAARFYRALYEEAQALGPLPPASNHYLATLRAKAGIPPPPAAPWQISPIQPQGPHPATPAPAAPATRP